MKQHLPIILVLVIVLAVMAYGQATTNLAGEKNVVVLDGTTNKVNINPVSAASIVNLATTTVTAITSIASRHKLLVKINSQDLTKVAYLNIGGVAAATEATGIRIDYSTPFEAELGPDVTAAWVSSGAAPVCVIQTSRP